MRYITHYEEYPIYEPAEGGYYYAGNQVVESERLSKRQCKKNLKELWEDAQKENEYLPEREQWVMFRDGTGIRRCSRYIGNGESYVIEKNRGSKVRGWQPYC